ncbi:MAG: NERD domain-containing protein, partial [Deltaproteobacteria bacterium]|nr:NERD domain-containing protein [Deltaproteobacteria bacterium]
MSQSRSSAERFVFERLLAALPSDQYAIHDSVEWMAVPSAPPGRAEGEIDFVICHRTRGVLVLEVKGGGVEFDTATGEWWSIDRHGARHAIADPMRQARQSARHLVGALKDAVGGFLPIPVGSAVAFPDVRW